MDLGLAPHIQPWLQLGAGSALFFGMLYGFRFLSLREASHHMTTTPWLGVETLTIVGRTEESRDIICLTLKRASGAAIPNFRPGQFLSFQIGDDAKVTRSYSICSSALQRDTVQVAVKRLSNGVGSQWLCDQPVGATVRAHGPSGHFSDDQLGNLTRIFIAGGVGLTPILSMIKTNAEKARGTMILFYGIRTSQDLAFHAELQVLVQNYPRLKYIPVMSEPDATWTHDKGFVTYELISQKTKISKDTHYFLCGPKPMTDAILKNLSDVPKSKIHIEQFASTHDLTGGQRTQRQATLLVDGKTYTYSGTQTILEFLEKQGLDIPYACRVGVCGSCQCKAEGPVETLTDTGLSPAEKEAGQILTCVAFPREGQLKLTLS